MKEQTALLPSAHSCSPPTLLVVDDEPLLAEYVASVAEEAGWNVELAFTAAEFERKLDEVQPDAIALDLTMPDRDGVELLRHLAARRFAGGLIIVSACDRPVVETSTFLAREHGLAVAGFAQKPVLAEEFSVLLERALALAPLSALDRSH